MIVSDLEKKYLSGPRSTKAIYGIILVTAVLIGFQFHETDSLTIAIKLFVAGLVIVLAEAYSELLGEKIRRKRGLSKKEQHEIIEDTMVISSVATYPVIIFLVSAAGLYSADMAFKVSYLLSVVGLGMFGYIASRAAGDDTRLALQKACITAFVGVVVIAAKYIVTH